MEYEELHRQAVLAVANYAQALHQLPHTTVDDRLCLKLVLDMLDGWERARLQKLNAHFKPKQLPAKKAGKKAKVAAKAAAIPKRAKLLDRRKISRSKLGA
ncbi:MAG: hypothetical protein SFV15_05425 [Polyangiaceae bacterium]|nr:hypothetical protein [Polyangiaceae bacterium]